MGIKVNPKPIIKEVDDRLTSQLADIAINVLSFGAVGDGVTDDTIAIQNALDYVFGLGGGTVLLPNDKSFYTTNTIFVKSNTTLTGGGAIVTDGNRFHDGVTVQDSMNVTIDGIKVYAKQSDGFNIGIRVNKGLNVTIKNNIIDNIGQLITAGEGRGFGIFVGGLGITSDPTTFSNNIKILNNTVTNVKGNGNTSGDLVYVYRTSNVIIDGNYLDTCQRMGIALTSFVENFSITNNRVFNPGAAAIDLESNDKIYDLRKGIINGNTLKNYGAKLPESVGSQFYAIDFHDKCEDVVFTNNVCEAGPNSKSHVFAINGARKLKILNNTFIGSVSDWACLMFSGSGAESWEISYNTFIGLTKGLINGFGANNSSVVGNTAYSNGSSVGIQFQTSTRNAIRDNKLFNFTVGISVSTTQSGHASENVVIDGNYVEFTVSGVMLRATGSALLESPNVTNNTLKGLTGALQGIEIVQLTSGLVNRLNYSGNVVKNATVNTGLPNSSASHHYVTNTTNVTTPFTGQQVYSFADQRLMQYNGSAWV